MRSQPNVCTNVPNEWSSKASSFLTNGCVVLFDVLDCQGDENPQIFSSFRTEFLNTYFSRPDYIPNYNLSGTK